MTTGRGPPAARSGRRPRRDSLSRRPRAAASLLFPTYGVGVKPRPSPYGHESDSDGVDEEVESLLDIDLLAPPRRGPEGRDKPALARADVRVDVVADSPALHDPSLVDVAPSRDRQKALRTEPHQTRGCGRTVYVHAALLALQLLALAALIIYGSSIANTCETTPAAHRLQKL